MRCALGSAWAPMPVGARMAPRRRTVEPRPHRVALVTAAGMARRLGQLELFPLEKPKPRAFQLQLPLTGSRSWELEVRPEAGSQSSIFRAGPVVSKA
jgi:hypothetical protein